MAIFLPMYFCKCNSSLNLLVSCSPHMALATGGSICFNSYRSMTKDYSTAKEFNASCSCWTFSPRNTKWTRCYYYLSNILPWILSSLFDISYERETSGRLMLILERPEEHVHVVGSKMLKSEAWNLKDKSMWIQHLNVFEDLGFGAVKMELFYFKGRPEGTILIYR